MPMPMSGVPLPGPDSAPAVLPSQPVRTRPSRQVGEDIARLGAAAASVSVPKGPGVRVGGEQVFMEGASETYSDSRRPAGVTQRINAAVSDRVVPRWDAYDQNIGYVVARRPVDLLPGGTSMDQFYQLTRRNGAPPEAHADEPAVGIYVRVLRATKFDRCSPAIVPDGDGLHTEQVYEVVLPESTAAEVFNRLRDEPAFIGTVIDHVVEQSLPDQAKALWRPSASGGAGLRPRVEDVVRYNGRGAQDPVAIAFVDHAGPTPTIDVHPMVAGRSAVRGTLE